MRTFDSFYVGVTQNAAASLCHLLEITTADGLVYYFTDLDKDVKLGSIVYRAAHGFNASAVTAAVGGTAQTITFDFLAGTGGVTKRMIDRGLMDFAHIIYKLYDYSLLGSTTETIPLFAGVVTDIAFGDSAICQLTATTLLGQDLPIAGDKYSPTCRHDFGDAGCGVNIYATNDRPRVFAMLDSQTLQFRVHRTGDPSLAGEVSPDGYYNNGTAVFFNGPVAGQGFEIAAFVNDGTSDYTYAYLKVGIMNGEDVTGSLVDLYGGCDKFLNSGCAYWNNTIRFGGEPFQVVPFLDLTNTATATNLAVAASTPPSAVVSPAVSATPVTSGAPPNWQQLLPFSTPAGNANDYTTLTPVSW